MTGLKQHDLEKRCSGRQCNILFICYMAGKMDGIREAPVLLIIRYWECVSEHSELCVPDSEAAVDLMLYRARAQGDSSKKKTRGVQYLNTWVGISPKTKTHRTIWQRVIQYRTVLYRTVPYGIVSWRCFGRGLRWWLVGGCGGW